MTPRDRAVLAAWVGLPTAAVVATMLAIISVTVGIPCVPLGVRWGVWADRCPATDLRLDVHAEVRGLVRGHDGGVMSIEPIVHWMVGDQRVDAPLRRGFSWRVALQSGAGEERTTLAVGRPHYTPRSIELPIELPADLKDGNYVLGLSIDAGFETAEVEVPVQVFAPAVAHLLTDRPLYRPGQDVLLRGLLLDRGSLAPIEARPGRWRIVDPDGIEVFAEQGETGGWGVVSTSFPLDGGAKLGRWTAMLESGAAQDRVEFAVRPFELPRTAVEVRSARPWFTVGDELVVEGVARYTSGAPIGGAPLVAELVQTDGRWPAPLDWSDERTGRTAPDGRFRVSFGVVPADLLESATFGAHVRVTDLAGETSGAATSLVVARESLKVAVLTELHGGLVEGASNRVYLRASLPDGEPVPGAELLVRRSATDEGVAATTDEDGVASLQLSPGSPITVVVPPVPVRVSPRAAEPPALTSAVRLGGDPVELGLDERRAIDARTGAIAACSAYAPGGADVRVGLAVNAVGRPMRILTGDDPASQCVAAAMRALVMSAGAPRTYELEWHLPDAGLPSYDWSLSTAYGGADDALFAGASARARPCLRAGQGVDGAPVLDVHWSVVRGSRLLALVVDEHPGHGLSAAAVACLRREVAQVVLPTPATEAAMGVASARIRVPPPAGAPIPEPTTLTAYQFAVRATVAGRSVGEGTVVVPVGQVPPLRLRADRPLVAPGEKLHIELLRGPGFAGDLPDELTLRQGARELVTVEVRENRAEFAVPMGVRGFASVAWGGARAVVFVRDPQPLTVEVASTVPVYRPGDTATLTVTTRIGEGPTSAAVALVGIDRALEQLARLTGPDDLARVTVRATSVGAAFGAFDPRALALGQVRGENAARAAVLSVGELAADAEVDEPARGSGEAQADVEGQLAASFYRVLARMTAKVRAWEKAAGPEDVLAPERAVDLWDASLAELREEGAPATDGYGRELRLNVLPPALLALSDPREIVLDAAHLPEDFVGWAQFVAAEVR